jgi:hypothetical protein
LHPEDCECATCKSLALSATRAAAAAAKAAAKRPRAGPTAGRASKRGFPTPATIELAQVYGLSESDSPQFNLSDLPTCGEGGRTEMPEPLHQDGGAGAAERPPSGTAPGDSASGQTPMQMDDNDDGMDVDHTNNDTGIYTVRRSATHHSGSRVTMRHHAASESRGPINIYEATAADIINMGKEQLDSKSRRKRKKRHKTKAAKQMAKTRTANTPSRDTLRLAAMAGDEPHRHCCSCNRTSPSSCALQVRATHTLRMPAHTLRMLRGAAAYARIRYACLRIRCAYYEALLQLEARHGGLELLAA